MRFPLRPTLALAALLACSACASREQSTVTAGERADYESDSERRLAAARAGLDSLKREAGLRADTTRARLQTQVAELETRREEAARELEALRASGARRWRDMKLEMADMLANLEAGVDTLRMRLRR